MVDAHQPLILQTMSKLTFNGHEYIVATLVRLSGSFPQQVYPFEAFSKDMPTAVRLPGLAVPIVTHYEGILRLVALPEKFEVPKEVTQNIKCRLASKHHMKKCLLVDPDAQIFEAIFPHQGENRLARPPADPPRIRQVVPQHEMQPVTPRPNSAGGHQPVPHRAYPGNGIDIRKASRPSNRPR